MSIERRNPHLEQTEKEACPNRIQSSCVQSTPTENSLMCRLNPATYGHLSETNRNPPQDAHTQSKPPHSAESQLNNSSLTGDKNMLCGSWHKYKTCRYSTTVFCFLPSWYYWPLILEGFINMSIEVGWGTFFSDEVTTSAVVNTVFQRLCLPSSSLPFSLSLSLSHAHTEKHTQVCATIIVRTLH